MPMKKLRPSKAKRVVRRARPARRVPRNLGTGGFTVVRKVPTIWLANSNTVGVPIVQGGGPVPSLIVGTPVVNPIFGNIYNLPFVFTFALNDLAQFSDFTNIADKYKITNVLIRAMYNATAVQGSTVANPYPSFMPKIKYVVDHDDGIVQPVNELDAKMGLKSKSFAEGKQIKMTVSPRVRDTVGGSGGSNAFAVPAKSMWINAGNDACPHYGIKGYVENFSLQSNTTATSCITFELEYTVKLKDLQ